MALVHATEQQTGALRKNAARARPVLAACLVVLAMLLPAGNVRAEEADAAPDVLPLADELPDYAPLRAWNGLGRFVELARGLGIGIDLVAEDDVKWDPATTVILVFPDRAPDSVALGEFVAAGGRVLVADDFGLGASALATLGVLRVAAPETPSVAFRQNPAFPIAAPTMRHPALDGVGAVVTNHPAALGTGPGGRCLLAFFAPPPACLLAEVDVGYGVALALADPSVLIDQMLVVEGNRRLAEGLLRYLTENRRPRILLVLPPDARATVQPRSPEGMGLRAAVRRWMARLSEPLAAAPPWFWLLTGVALLVWAALGRIRPPSAEDFAPPRLLHAERLGPALAYPRPERPELWRPFAQEAVDVMHAAVARRLEEVSERLGRASKTGEGLRARMRLRLERSRLRSLQRRLRGSGDDAADAPGERRLRRLAEDFLRTGAKR
jgi:hypothetical protein